MTKEALEALDEETERLANRQSLREYRAWKMDVEKREHRGRCVDLAVRASIPGTSTDEILSAAAHFEQFILNGDTSSDFGMKAVPEPIGETNEAYLSPSKYALLRRAVLVDVLIPDHPVKLSERRDEARAALDRYVEAKIAEAFVERRGLD